jgi:hypothetical protein
MVTWTCACGEECIEPQPHLVIPKCKNCGCYKSEINIKKFLKEIREVCYKYEISISHEDSQGGFQLEIYNDRDMEWLEDASIRWKLQERENER